VFSANICEIIGSEERGKFVRLDRRLRGPGGRGFCPMFFILKMVFSFLGII
jgi:hypothetical protein